MTGRLRNLVVDPATLPLKGVETIERFYDGLAQSGLYVSDTWYKRMAERSKVTYQWQVNNPDIQVRVDSYRQSTLIGFLKLKENILEKVNSPDIELLDQSNLNGIILTIELNLMQYDKKLDIELLKKFTEFLNDYCLMLGIKEEELKQFGFHYFRDSLGKKATGNGFLIEATGIRKNDDFLEIEKQSFYDFINNAPPFMELNRLSHFLKDKNHANLVKLIGSVETCDGEDLYANFFLQVRRYNLVKNDGYLVVPPYIEKSITLLNNMIRIAYESNLNYSEKKYEIKKLKEQMIFYKNTDYKFRHMIDNNEKEKVLYLEKISNEVIKYKIKEADEIYTNNFHVLNLPYGIHRRDSTRLTSGDMAWLNSVKQEILNITSARGHTKKELTC